MFGFGPEGFYGPNAITEGDTPHNEYLQIAAYLGIPGLILYLTALVSLAVHHFRRIKALSPLVLAVSGVTVVYLFSACFGNPVFNTVPFYWMFLGMTTATGETEQPLICVDRETLSPLFADRIRKERSIIAIVGALLLMAVVGVRTHAALRDERLFEYTDLMAMRNADLAAQAEDINGRLADGAYWYDAPGFRLIPADQPRPAPYGLGHRAEGDTWYAFCEQFGVIYPYDESTDYTNRIVQLTAATDANGNRVTDIRWVVAEG